MDIYAPRRIDSSLTSTESFNYLSEFYGDERNHEMMRQWSETYETTLLNRLKEDGLENRNKVWSEVEEEMFEQFRIEYVKIKNERRLSGD